MPIIINDFEVVVEPKPTQGSQTAETQQKDETGSLWEPRPEDIEQVIRRLAQRQSRLQAD